MAELDRVKREMRARGVAALRAIGDDLLGEAQRLAPVREGTLRGSGHVEITETMTGAEVVVSFSTPYAARQHEETSWNHPKGGQAKYLEQPLTQRAGRYERLLGAAIGKGL